MIEAVSYHLMAAIAIIGVIFALVWILCTNQNRIGENLLVSLHPTQNYKLIRCFDIHVTKYNSVAIPY